MRVGTNLGRKSVAESKSYRSVVAGEPLLSPRGELLEEGAEQEERNKVRRGRRNGGKGKEGTSNMFFSMTTAFGNLIKAIAVIHNTGLWQIN